MSTEKQNEERLRVARDRYDQGVLARKDQLAREKEDLRFYGGDQWDQSVKDARAGQSASNAPNALPPVPARPTYTINKLREPVRQVLNQERQSDMGIELVPADDFGDLVQTDNTDEIEIREGLIRRIQRDSQAADARTWAFMRSTIAGVGYYMVLTRYLPGKTNDQEVYVHRIYNQNSVVLDPFHEQPDGSDAKWGFVGVDMSWDEYKHKYPASARRLAGLASGQKLKETDEPIIDDAAWGKFCEDSGGWFSLTNKKRGVRVTDYWYVDFEDRALVEMADGSVLWADEVPENAQASIVEGSKRTVVEQTVTWCQINGIEILDETEWPAPDLPIVKVLGEELQPYDDERRVEGMVRQSRDGQKGFNGMISKWVEVIAMSPIPTMQAAPEQIQGFETWYQVRNTRTLPYLPFNVVNGADGKPLDRPSELVPATDAMIGALSASVHLFDMAIQSTSGVPDAQLGKVDPSARSGKAIKLLQEQSMHGTSNYLDNLRRSIRYEGQIENNLLYPIYGKKPGRLVRIMNGEGESRTVQIAGTPPQGPQPAPQSPGLLQRIRSMMPGQSPAQPPQGQQATKQYTLSEDATFNVIVKVTQSYESRRTQEAATIAELLSANPALMQWFGDLFFKNQDGPGHEEMADRAKVMLDPKILAYLQSKEDGQHIDPAAMAQVQQLQAQLKHAEQLLQQAKQEMDADVAKSQADYDGKLKVAKAEAERDFALQIMKDATTIDVAKINALSKGVLVDAQAQVEALALRQSQAHEMGMAAAGASGDAGQAQADREHQAAEGAAGRDATAQEGAAQRAAAAQEGQAQRDAAAAEGDAARKAAAEQASQEPT